MRPKPSRDDDQVLVIDQGGHSTRCLVFDRSGAVTAQARREIETRRPLPGQVEHDPLAILESLNACLLDVAATLGKKSRTVTAAALCTQRSSIVCWSRKTGLPLSPVLSWQDTRAAKFLESLPIDESALFTVTGLVKSPHYGAGKMRWCLDNLPPVQEALRQNDLALGPLSSYLVHALSDRKTLAVDPANGSRTLLYDVANSCWSPALLAKFGIDGNVLPAIKSNRFDWATLDLGRHAVPLILVTGDQSAVPYACADDPRNQCFLNLGTGGFLQCPVDERIAVPGLLNSVILQSDGGTAYAVEGTINGAGAALSWFANDVDIDGDTLTSNLSKWLQQTPSPPLFVNTVGGVGSPFWKSGVTPRFNGPRLGRVPDTPSQATAVIESIAFLVTANLDAMRRSAVPLAEIIVSGGLSSLDGLLQRISTLTSLPICRSDYIEASAYGAARLAMPLLPPLQCETAFRSDSTGANELRHRYDAWYRLMEAL